MTVDDVAREAGVARATLYRAFPGGKGTLVEAVLGRELHRFFAELADELARHVDAEQLLVAGVGRSLRFFATHPALRGVLAHEPGLVLSRARKSVVWGKRGSGRVGLGGCRSIKKKK